MKPDELKAMSPQQLEEQLLKLRREQFDLRMQRSTGQLAQFHHFPRVRREIARVKTAINAQRKQETVND
ncbi:50S ribosomal protein L29 [Candidatus Macondimonas diazotrophica]|jgi:large subunit ribosomal protein L29|uniref:Large ribosomal subunit protein uL29 n=1 Tax=Candidatus Macondimonas diazotrophica TaxID=2305248 RepID=A0A4Z0F8M2_9GAMM|nr:50S ribosomal protein L29 [Candidatus Macondimonas diazotrophica]NCU01402.1 50S ribosomal protein L29 [Candidatus Macondimonas diazotrophica]TFZ81963.1 50S ribosomal protein L29 [Candidatus Macondimonas diazotrophica]HBG31373.1 50S ribosomal protein L29 [Gammaproteobacteria bacterium]HBG51180.1 50S ribosomal protein L29 [Gammaproteobacteria bacterium]